MKPTKIYYERVFPIAQYVNEKVGIELTLDPDESLDKGYATARSIVFENHKKNHPELFSNVPFPPPNEPPIIQTQSKSQGKQSSLAEQISSSPNLTILKTYEFLLKNSTDKDAKKSYEKRLEELMSQPIK